MSRIAWIPALLSGCVLYPSGYHPAERDTAAAPDGYLAAEYDLRASAADEDLGQARVWSRGAFAGEQAASVHVGFAVENKSAAKILALDRRDLWIDAALDGGAKVENLGATRFEGPDAVAAGETGEVHVYFSLPPSVRSYDVRAYRVRWSLRVDGREGAYCQTTSFLENRHPRYRTGAYWYTPYWDPFWHWPYFYPGIVFHFGWYHHRWHRR